MQLYSKLHALDELIERRRHAAARRIAQDAHRAAFKYRRAQAVERRAVGLDIALHHAAARQHDRSAVIANGSGDDDIIARTYRLRAESRIFQKADARGVDIYLVAASALDYLRIPGHDLHPGLFAGLAYRLNDACQLRRGEALFYYKCTAEIFRFAAAHCDIVHRAADG